MTDKVFINPQFVSAALSGITHRFVLILECETRHYSDPNKQVSLLHLAFLSRPDSFLYLATDKVYSSKIFSWWT